MYYISRARKEIDYSKFSGGGLDDNEDSDGEL